jgi:hypothetical protein
MDKFPIPLDYQFLTHNLTRQQEILNLTREGSTFGSFDLLFFPYPSYFHGYHYPATFKWGMPSLEYLPITIPVDCYMEVFIIEEGHTVEIDGTECMVNVRVHYHLSPYIIMEIGHMNPNMTLIDKFNNEKKRLWGHHTNDYGIFIPAGTVVGFTNPSGERLEF